jgi:hypothetical protein
MAVDGSIFAGQRTLRDYIDEGQMNAAKIAHLNAVAASAGGSVPAAIQIANEYDKARKAGDVQRMNDLTMAAKSLEKGQQVDANGNIIVQSGFLPAVQSTSNAKETGQNTSDLVYKPQIANQVANQTEQGKTQGEAGAALTQQTAQFPQLEAAVSDLSTLGKKATYTYSGRALNEIIRQAGGNLGAMPAGAVARDEYISKVDNQILPLLRQTFGAQFTAKEGETLRATLGAPNLAPEEKDAVLRSFIDQKSQQIKTLERQTGFVDPSTVPPPINYGQRTLDHIMGTDQKPKMRLKYNQSTGDFE